MSIFLFPPLSKFGDVTAKPTGFGMGNLINPITRCFIEMLFFKSSRPNPFSDGSLFFMRSSEVIWNIEWLLCWLIFGVLHEWQSIQSNSRYSRFEFHYLGLHGKIWQVIPRIYIHPFIVSAMPGWQLPRQERCLQAPSLSLHLGGHLTSSCQWNVRASLLKGVWGHLYCLFPFSS